MSDIIGVSQACSGLEHAEREDREDCRPRGLCFTLKLILLQIKQLCNTNPQPDPADERRLWIRRGYLPPWVAVALAVLVLLAAFVGATFFPFSSVIASSGASCAFWYAS